MTTYGTPLWTPSPARIARSAMHRFSLFAESHGAGPFPDYRALHAWSIESPSSFWQLAAAFTGVRWQTPARASFLPPPTGKMRGAKWFPGATLNYAENLLLGAEEGLEDREVVVAYAEGAPRRAYTAAQLRAAVARCAAALRAAGVGPGDCVAGVVGNLPEALIAMLATAALGGIWSSCSPDFGAAAVCDRLSQVRPKVVFFTSSYAYNGKTFDLGPTIAQSLERLAGVQTAVLIDHLGKTAAAPARATSWDAFLGGAAQAELAFAPRAFDDPLFILFSSGTTGVPKCITHGVGGTLLQHKKELLLHGDVGPDARLLYYTTCGWMMWNWMVSALATGASLVLFEGSVSHPDLGALWSVVRDERVTHFGTSPKFLGACMSAGLDARAILDDDGAAKGGVQRALQTVFSTGSPLLPEHFSWVYGQLGPDLHLASISGGTDIISCFMLGNPALPVRSGEIQCLGLGMAVEAWDDGGRPVLGEKGELVCKQPFVSMPVCFWNDPEGTRYRAAYFERYAASSGREVWRHGDFIEITPDGGVVVYGRSDATLNPGGVRIGTAELYRMVETFPGVADALAVGERDGHGDTNIILFVKLKPGVVLDDGMAAALKKTIRAGLTPRHVPYAIHAVDDIPYTRSGKKVEIAATQAIHGEAVQNIAALANPESLDAFVAYGKKKKVSTP